MQSFIQVFCAGDWLRLPTGGQRLIAFYVLGFQFLQAVTGVLAPIGLLLAIFTTAPTFVVLMAMLPLIVSIWTLIIDLLMLRDFGRAYPSVAALLLAGALSRIAAAWWPRSGHKGRVGFALAVVTAVLFVAPGWYSADRAMMTSREEPTLKQAEDWIATTIPRNQVVVVHDALWTDLVAKDGFPRRNVIIIYKLDNDPAVRQSLRRIDYLVLPDYYYETPTGTGQYATALLAKDRAVPVAHFGSDRRSSVTIYRVSDAWSPQSAASPV